MLRLSIPHSPKTAVPSTVIQDVGSPDLNGQEWVDSNLMKFYNVKSYICERSPFSNTGWEQTGQGANLWKRLD